MKDLKKVPLNLSEGDFPRKHRYSTNVIHFAHLLYTNGLVGFQAIARIFRLINEYIMPSPTPHYSTIRLWTYRTGLYELTKSLKHANDWVWIQDEVIDIGAIRCLVVIGLPMSSKQENLTLSHGDMQVIGILPTNGLTGDAVADKLRECELRTGKPLQVINDGGANLKKGVRQYCRNSETLMIQDITHKMALLLEKTLKSDDTWINLLEAMSASKRKVKQTELAGIMSPNLRDKARYMSADTIVKWGMNIEGVVIKEVSNDRIQKYFGWIQQFSPSLKGYKDKIEISNVVKEIIRKEGYSKHSYRKTEEAILKFACDENLDFIDKTLAIILEEVEKLGESSERAIGSSEVLESIFGKFKYISRNGNQGITANILSIPNFVGKKEPIDIRNALEGCPVKELTKWIRATLGVTVNSVRNKFFGKRNKKCVNFNERVIA